MNILLIPDKFKGSITAQEVINALSSGIKRANPDVKIYSILASDGGDGFLSAISRYISLKEILVDTVDPLGGKIIAPYLLDENKNIAYIELASASGLALLKPSEQMVMQTSTYGTGLQVRDALSRKAKYIYIGLGGSATNDGGIGIAKALGYSFMDDQGKDLQPIGKNLIHINKISKAGDVLGKTLVFAINDVNNPLFGSQGAAYVYAKQKGASDLEIKALDLGLQHLEGMVKRYFKKDISLIPGVGAAGGTAFGLKAFFNAKFIGGIEFILQLAKVDELLSEIKFDYILTGEGKIDEQTMNGKLIKGVMDLGTTHTIPVIGICGKAEIKGDERISLSLEAILEINDPSKSLTDNMDNTYANIENAIYDYLKTRIG